MARDWFFWNGERCDQYGIRALELPPVTLAEERVDFETVAGRSGSLAMLEGEEVYEDMTLNCTCVLMDRRRLDDAAAWLRGSGRVTFANRPGGWYEARIVNQIELTKVIAAREPMTFTLSFRAQPWFYLREAEDIEITGTAHTLQNPGNLPSAPRIAVYGSGDVGLTLGGQLVRLTDLDGGIVLDTELQDALDLEGARLLNGQMDGDFMVIPTGLSQLAWISDDENDNPGYVTKIVVTPRWRCR